jgi:hypothetical protein
MLEKKYSERMRFISASNIHLNSILWQQQVYELKSYLRQNSQYQLNDYKIYWSCDFELNNCIAEISVLGPDTELPSDLKTYNQEAGNFWIAKLPSSTFNSYFFDFDSLKPEILMILENIPGEIGKKFHLVMDDEKIELHFFLEKDYIG